ncbi:sulfate transporter family-domain-containing protein [Phycomyces blakesleeanus]|uniref:Sulfate transporter family-domain-containing protein n=1 Tax=Phycomyces blakesleeanus TaxID=4837 RepID=A0ABR3B205_PHYBL
MAEPILLEYEPLSHRQEATKIVRKIPNATKTYVAGLFPIVQWIHRYNLTWLVSDLIAGITVGIVVVPQGMGYAKIANLPPQYGLYSSFVGLCIYCFFGTSKDISIGPTAVMSLLVGQAVAHVTEVSDYTGPQVAVTLALISGVISIFIGLVRLGILVDFIPGPAIAGFMTGSAITITIGQWPNLFGLQGVDTHDAAYLIFGNFFKRLPTTHYDAIFGLLGLIWLYSVRWGTGYLTKKYPKYSRHLFFFNIMRNGILVIVGTLIAYLIQIGKASSPVSILKTVPSGFQAMGVPVVDTTLLGMVSGTLPSVVIILILEHVAIAKSFGRINNYKIKADQEIIAIGVANVIGSFFGAYPNTGSFSRTAIKARSGVRTPLAGVFSGLVVLLSLYALTPAFYYIPNAILSAVIIHAVADLASGPKFWKQLWLISPFEFFTFVAAILITFFTSVEYGIYVSVGLSIVSLLLRIARPRCAVLGRVPVYPSQSGQAPGTVSVNGSSTADSFGKKKTQGGTSGFEEDVHYIYVKKNHPSLHHLVEDAPQGVVIFRFDESLTYPNASFISDKVMHHIQDNFSSAVPISTKKGDRAWNDHRPLPKKGEVLETVQDNGPRLYAIVLDCSAVNHLDSTGVQTLLDLRLAIDRLTEREVEWHFASLASPAIRNTLITSGFGTQAGRGPRTGELLPVVPAHRDGPQTTIDHTSTEQDIGHIHIDMDEKKSMRDRDIERNMGSSEKPYDSESECSLYENVSDKLSYCPRASRGLPIDRYPFFHWDLEDAVRAASYTASRAIRNNLP